MEKTEKKVEYIELIYDLIFVYMIGRNNSLLGNIVDGFVPYQTFLAYVMCTLAVIQIWNFSTYYINLYGRNSLRNYIFLLFNMFMLYSMGVGTTLHWEEYRVRYHIAWGLIILNCVVQYIFELRKYKDDPAERRGIRRAIFVLAGEAVLIGISTFFEGLTGIALSGVAIAFGIVFSRISGRVSHLNVDFMHLSERAMLYVVFTFGEMIIAIVTYFDDELSVTSFYMALMAFLIVVGLFLSYGIIYDKITDREMKTDGLNYMLIHVFLIFGLNNTTVSLEFMHEEEVSLLPKIIALVVSLMIYYICLFLLKRYAKKSCVPGRTFNLELLLILIIYAALMIILRNYMVINITVTAACVFLIFILLYSFVKKMDRCPVPWAK